MRVSAEGDDSFLAAFSARVLANPRRGDKPAEVELATKSAFIAFIRKLSFLNQLCQLVGG